MKKTTQVLLTVPLFTDSDLDSPSQRQSTERLQDSCSGPSIWADTPADPHLPTVCGCDSWEDARAWRFAAFVSIASTLIVLILFFYSRTY